MTLYLSFVDHIWYMLLKKQNKSDFTVLGPAGPGDLKSDQALPSTGEPQRMQRLLDVADQDQYKPSNSNNVFFASKSFRITSLGVAPPWWHADLCQDPHRQNHHPRCRGQWHNRQREGKDSGQRGYGAREDSLVQTRHITRKEKKTQPSPHMHNKYIFEEKCPRMPKYRLAPRWFAITIHFFFVIVW